MAKAPKRPSFPPTEEFTDDGSRLLAVLVVVFGVWIIAMTASRIAGLALKHAETVEIVDPSFIALPEVDKNPIDDTRAAASTPPAPVTDG